jgi:hypothetical protein
MTVQNTVQKKERKKETLWPESTSELYRPGDSRFQRCESVFETHCTVLLLKTLKSSVARKTTLIANINR